MGVSIEQVQDAVKRARSQVMVSGISEDADLVALAIATLDLIGGQSQQPHPKGTSPTPPLPFPETFAEWAVRFNLENHYDRFLAALMYMREKSQATSANTDEILQFYKKARWEMPKNPADIIAKASKRIWLTEAEDTDGGEDGKKRWQITSTGYTYFQSLAKENVNGQ